MNLKKEISLSEHVRFTKTFLQEYIYNVFKYYILKESDSEFITSYIKLYGSFNFMNALTHYLRGSPLEIIDSGDYIELKRKDLGSK